MTVSIDLIKNHGITGDFAAVAADVKAALDAVDALGSDANPVAIGTALSSVQLSGSDAAPTVTLIWTHRPVHHGVAVPIEAAAQAAIESGVASSTVVHSPGPDLSGIGMGDLASALGL